MTFRHEGTNDGIAADGRAAAVMGDQGNEFIYRFISRNRCSPGSSLADRDNVAFDFQKNGML